MILLNKVTCVCLSNTNTMICGSPQGFLNLKLQNLQTSKHTTYNLNQLTVNSIEGLDRLNFDSFFANNNKTIEPLITTDSLVIYISNLISNSILFKKNMDNFISMAKKEIKIISMFVNNNWPLDVDVTQSNFNLHHHQCDEFYYNNKIINSTFITVKRF